MRLIDADVLVVKARIIAKKQDEESDGISSCLATFLQDVVDGAPTVDAEPVKRGFWEKVSNDIPVPRHFCSNCDRKAMSHLCLDVSGNGQHIAQEDLTDYCPFCGARMNFEE